jgi:3-isopropylmalate/(R)-2-methylmalate dehydratase small subunit
MKPFIRHEGVAAVLPRDNIDTDAIIPSREMRTVSRSGLADGLFAPWRYTDPDARAADSDFVLNQAEFSGASVLITGHNFGCGSSREHAVWALMEYGFRVVLATSFATIFRNNALRNGLLTIQLAPDQIDRISAWVRRDPQANQPRIDLEACSIQTDPAAEAVPFQIEANAREMLLKGLDEIGLTEQSLDAIAAFEARDRALRPWVYLTG